MPAPSPGLRLSRPESPVSTRTSVEQEERPGQPTNMNTNNDTNVNTNTTWTTNTISKSNTDTVVTLKLILSPALETVAVVIGFVVVSRSFTPEGGDETRRSVQVG